MNKPLETPPRHFRSKNVGRIYRLASQDDYGYNLEIIGLGPKEDPCIVKVGEIVPFPWGRFREYGRHLEELKPTSAHLKKLRTR